MVACTAESVSWLLQMLAGTGVKAKTTQQACETGCNPPGFYTYKQKEINHKSCLLYVWKKAEGKVFPGRRFKFHSWENWCDQSRGMENILRREAGAGELYSPNLLFCQLSDVKGSKFPFAPFSYVIIFFSQLLHFFQNQYFRLSDHFTQERWRWWSDNIFVQVLRSPRRVWQWLPPAPAVRFVCSGSESNQLSMINMKNSHWNHSFLWETTVRLCIKPWVNKPPPPALLVTDQMVEQK